MEVVDSDIAKMFSTEELKNLSNERYEVFDRIKSIRETRMVLTNPTVLPDYELLKILNVDRLFPNYPHVYDWSNDHFRTEYMNDFLNIARVSESVDRFVILYCVRLYLDRSDDKRSPRYSETLSLGFGYFISAYLETTERIRTLSDIVRIDDPRFLAELPFDLLKPTWYELYRAININDFMRFIASVLPSRLTPIVRNESFDPDSPIKTFRQAFAYNDTVVLFQLCMWWLLDFDRMLPKTREIAIEIFTKFTTVENYIMALPFGFLTPVHLVWIYTHVTKYEIYKCKTLPLLQRIARNFTLRFRNVGVLDEYASNEKFTFNIPNARFVDLKLNFLIRRNNKNNGERLNASPLNGIKLLGILPRRFIGNIDFHSNDVDYLEIHAKLDACKSENLVNFGRSRFVEDFLEFASLNDYEADYFARTEDLSFTETNFEKPPVNVTKKSSRFPTNFQEKRCVGCDATTTDVIFLPCTHAINCQRCFDRSYRGNVDCGEVVEYCLLCRRYIAACIDGRSTAVDYDDCQRIVLKETLSMFRKYFCSDEYVDSLPIRYSEENMRKFVTNL